MTFQECNWVETKWENWNFWWQKRWHRVLTVSSQSEASRATTAVLLLSLLNIFILIAFSYYELLRSNTQHSTTIIFSLLLSSSSSYTIIKLQVLVDKDPGLTGNLLVERLVGAHVHLISKEEYAKLGSVVCLFCTNAFRFTAMRFLLCCYCFLHLNFKNFVLYVILYFTAMHLSMFIGCFLNNT